MGSLGRLYPFVMRQKRGLFLSVILSVIAAVFSVAQLSLIYPSMKLFLEGKNLDAHVQNELDAAKAAVALQSNRLQALEAHLRDPQWCATRSAAELKNERADVDKTQDKLIQAQRNQIRYEWVQSAVLPWVPKDGFDYLAFILGTLLVFTLLKEACSYLQEIIVGSVVQRVTQSLRQQLFRNTLKLDQQTLTLETTPHLMSRFTFDLSQVAVGLGLLGSRIILEPLKAIICVGCAFLLNWRLTLLAFICAPLMVLFFGRLRKKMKRASQRQMESMSRVYQVLTESLSTVRTVQAYRNERLHRRRLMDAHRAYYEKALRILRMDSLVSPSVEFIAMCAVFVASLPGAYLVLRHKTAIWGVQLAAEQMTFSDLALIYTCLAGVLDPGRKLSSVYSKLKRADAACGRVFDWMDKTSLVTQSPSAQSYPPHQASIEFDQVYFHYATLDDSKPPRRGLDQVSLTIPFGSTVAVVGENGCGKSTLVNMLPRLFDPQSGQIRIDGVPICDIDLASLRRQIGIVTQDTLLFDWTILENIRYGNPQATRDEVSAAADLACVTDFVSQMPEGFETEIGQYGHRLSGGQRQRVALARALLRNPAILILDEATSAIDTQSEQIIFQNLRHVAGARTTLVVTHAITPSLLKIITHVVVMDQGTVMAVGPHDEVLQTCPLYRRLFNAQALKRAG